MIDPSLQDLQRYRLIDLITFRRDGEPVPTPVRYAIDGGRLVVSLQSGSGKVKRATNNPAVRVAGHPKGRQYEATLTFLHGDEARRASKVLQRRHRLLFVQRFLLGRHPRRHTAAEIRPA